MSTIEITSETGESVCAIQAARSHFEKEWAHRLGSNPNSVQIGLILHKTSLLYETPIKFVDKINLDSCTLHTLNTALSRGCDTARVYIDFLRCFGFKRLDIVTRALVWTQTIWTLANLWSKNNKDWYTRQFALHLGQMLPPDLEIEAKLPYAIEHFVALKAKKYGKRRWTFLTSLLHGLKKGFPKVPDTDFTKAAADLRSCLTQHKDIEKNILDAVADTSYEIFVKGNPSMIGPGGSKPDSCNWYSYTSTLSTNAITESGRSKGGILGECLRRTFRDDIQTIAHICLTSPVLIGFREDDDLNWTEVYGAPITMVDVHDLPDECVDNEILHVFLLPEALKIRPITVGTYSSAASGYRILQWMRRGLMRFPQFALTRETVTIDHINKLIHNLGIDELLRSADFSGATNEFAFELSQAACRHFPEPYKSRVIKALCSNKTIQFEWGDKAKNQNCVGSKVEMEFPDQFVQTNGQLMGCWASFPILCVVNLALLRLAVELYNGTRVAIKDINCLINGDDNAFPGTPGLIAVWELVVEKAGLILSPGKNYDSREFVIINSELFPIHSYVQDEEDYQYHISEGLKCAEVVHKPDLVNMGLITGRQKGWDETVDDQEYGDKSVQDSYTVERVCCNKWWTNMEACMNVSSEALRHNISHVFHEWVYPALSQTKFYSKLPFVHLTADLKEKDYEMFWYNQCVVQKNRPERMGQSPKDGSWNLLEYYFPEKKTVKQYVSAGQLRKYKAKVLKARTYVEEGRHELQETLGVPNTGKPIRDLIPYAPLLEALNSYNNSLKEFYECEARISVEDEFYNMWVLEPGWCSTTSHISNVGRLTRAACVLSMDTQVLRPAL